MLSYQGKLTDTMGIPVNDTTYQVAFRLYTVPSGGSSFWNETQPVTTKSGLFSVLFGSVTPIGAIPDGGALYLGMAVAGGSEMTPRLRIVSAAYAYKADTANYALASAGGGDNAWVRGTPDSVLCTVHLLGLARGGASNMLYGASRQSHVNFGVTCTTGVSGLDYANIVISGGSANRALADHATIGGGRNNTAESSFSTVSGGRNNTAVRGYAVVGGGQNNTAAGDHSAVLGGSGNNASGYESFIGGGDADTASGEYAALCGGIWNLASGDYAAVGGGRNNVASGPAATVAGGYGDTAAGSFSFAVGASSAVPDGEFGSAAFNGQVATASNQLRCGTISKAGGSFTIDDPVDPSRTILNHYFIEGPEMRNLYDGEAKLDASGRAVVTLPGYFDALNRNPRVQLTGVGSSDVFVAQEVVGNQFTIGGKAGTKVFWQVTGERKDVSAEAIRRMMPVEQPKTGALAGRMLDDDFLAGCMNQLVREGKAQGIDFRTAAGRAKYEKMKQHLREVGQQ